MAHNFEHPRSSKLGTEVAVSLHYLPPKMFLSLTDLRERRLQRHKETSSGKNRLVISRVQNSPALLSIISTFLVFLPAIVVGLMVLTNAVNIPVWDDWERGVMLQKYYAQSPDFASYMLGAHIDHRMFVPRLLMLMMNDLTGGNLWWEVVLSFSLYLGGAICLFKVLKKTLGDNLWMYSTALLANIALFSPVQYQNFMWAVQIAMLLPFACFGMMMYAFVADKWPIWRRFTVVLLSALVGTLSFGHGLVLWPVAFMMPLLLRSLGTMQTRLAFAGGMAVAATATLSAYFLWNFENVSVHAYGQMPGETPPGVKNFAAKPDEVFRFMLTAMGNSLARIFPDAIEFGPKMGRIVLGVLIGTVGICLYTVRRYRDRAAFDRLLPWMAMAGYSVVVMFAMGMGRGAHGWESGIHSRYAGPSVFLVTSLVVMVGWILYQWRERAVDPHSREMRTRWAMAIAFLFVGVQIPTWTHSSDKMHQWKLSRLQQKASLLYLKHFEPRHHRRHDHTLEFVKEQAFFMNEKGLLNPPLFEKADFGDFKKSKTTLEYSRADLLAAGITPQGLFLRGFANVRGPDRLADGVLVTYREMGNKTWHVVEMAEMNPVFFDANEAIDAVFSATVNLYLPKNHAKWDEMVPIDVFPQDKNIEVGFWAMDADKMRVQRMDTSLKFNLADTPVGTVLFDANKVALERKAKAEAKRAAERDSVAQAH